MAQWGHGQQLSHDMYGRYGSYPVAGGGYPNASASGSPMNYGAYYPPTTYSSSPAFNNASSGPSYRGGYPATSGSTTYATSHPVVSTTGSSAGQYTTGAGGPALYTTAASFGGQYTSAPLSMSYVTSATYGNGYTPPTTAGFSANYEPALINAIQNMSFGR